MGVTKNNLAHINCWGQEQSLQAHSKAAAKYTAAVMSKIGLKNLGYLAGLLHDMGKGKAEFYEYLYRIYRKEKVVKGNINHTFAAVIFIYERYHKSDDSFELFTAELLACAVGSHHGLFDCVDLYSKKSGFVKRLEKISYELENL